MLSLKFIKYYEYFQKNSFKWYAYLVIDDNSINSIEFLIKNFYKQKQYSGVILLINKNSLHFTQLYFLKNIIFELFLHKKSVALTGLPYCVQQYLFGGFDFTRIDNILEEFNPVLFNVETLLAQESHLKIKCKNCVAHKTCFGLGNINENDSMWSFRIKNNVRVSKKAEINFSDSIIQKKHTAFLSHILNSGLWRTDRTIKYSTAFGMASDYEQRFIYYARYLDINEIKKEYSFLVKNVINKDILSIIFNGFYNALKLQGVAYTLAKKKDSYRETFYVYFVNSTFLNEFLKFYKLNLIKNNFFEYIYFVGLDFEDSILKEYKIYSNISNVFEWLSWMKINFFIQLPYDLILNSYNFVLVRRYLRDGSLKSIKVELTPKKKNIVESILVQEYGFNVFCKNKKLFNSYYALDFSLNGKLNKITTYHSNKF